ncbi:MAG: hypothetical protein R3Y53_04325 [Bacillota bacterium]
MKRQEDSQNNMHTSIEPEIIHNKEMKLDGIAITPDQGGTDNMPKPLKAVPHIEEHAFAEDDLETDVEITGVVEVAQATQIPKNAVMDSTRASTRMAGNRFRVDKEMEKETTVPAPQEPLEDKQVEKKVKQSGGKHFRPAWTKIVVENFNPLPKDGVYIRREDIRGFYFISGLTLFSLTLFAMFPKKRRF